MKTRILSILLPIVTLAIIVAVWHAYVVYFDIPDYILPVPYAVFDAFVSSFVDGTILPHFLFTARSMVIGYTVGCVFALVLGSLVAESALFEKCVYPYVVALQSTPKVAIAPLLFVWFGFGIESKVVMVSLICFFPVFVNTMVGIKRADPGLVDVMRAASASRMQIFWHVRFPGAASSIFAGLQIGVVLGLIGAIVAEFVASRYGLGRMIVAAAADLDVGTMLATVVVLVGMGVAGTTTVRWLHRRVVFWEGQRDDEVNVEVY